MTHCAVWCLSLILLAAYIILGAVVFSYLESTHDKRRRDQFEDYLQQFRVDFNIPERDLEELINRVYRATATGISPQLNVSAETNWSFGQAFFFAGTLISTVGYGHVSPTTYWGKAFTIVYCLIGIPLTLTLLTAVVERLRVPSLWFRAKLCCWMERFSYKYGADVMAYVHLAITGGVLIVLLFLIPSIIFSEIEPDWTFMDAFYYCFISLTTIGLGDYIPGDRPAQQYRGIYKVAVTVYLLIGLCGMMLLLATLYDIPQLNLSRFFALPEDALLCNNDANNDDKQSESATGPAYNRQIDEASISEQPSVKAQKSRDYGSIEQQH